MFDAHRSGFYLPCGLWPSLQAREYFMFARSLTEAVAKDPSSFGHFCWWILQVLAAAWAFAILPLAAVAFTPSNTRARPI